MYLLIDHLLIDPSASVGGQGTVVRVVRETWEPGNPWGQTGRTSVFCPDNMVNVSSVPTLLSPHCSVMNCGPNGHSL
jgi:hypothetical protein